MQIWKVFFKVHSFVRSLSRFDSLGLSTQRCCVLILHNCNTLLMSYLHQTFLTLFQIHLSQLLLLIIVVKIFFTFSSLSVRVSKWICLKQCLCSYLQTFRLVQQMNLFLRPVKHFYFSTLLAYLKTKSKKNRHLLSPLLLAQYLFHLLYKAFHILNDQAFHTSSKLCISCLSFHMDSLSINTKNVQYFCISNTPKFSLCILLLCDPVYCIKSIVDEDIYHLCRDLMFHNTYRAF